MIANLIGTEQAPYLQVLLSMSHESKKSMLHSLDHGKCLVDDVSRNSAAKIFSLVGD